MTENTFRREVAFRVSVKNILNGSFVAKNDAPNHLLINNKKISRVNVIGSILQKEIVGSITNLLFDDGTGTIVVRSFEENTSINSLSVGDIVLLIGKPRMYNKERYLSPEIVKNVNPLWLKVRSFQLESVPDVVSKPNQQKDIIKEDKTIEMSSINEELEVVGDQELQTVQKHKEDVVLSTDKVTKLIKELDEGEGVLIETVIEKSPMEETDQLIQKMLETGDIFQISPGKIKVL